MTLKQIVKATLAMSAVGMIVLSGMRLGPPKVHADEQDSVQDLAEIGSNR